MSAGLHGVCVAMFCGTGADGNGPPGGGAVQPHPEAHCWNQLPLRRPHSGGHEYAAGHSAAAGAGITLKTQTRETVHRPQDHAGCVTVRRAWSCVESSPCRWKT